MTVKQQVKAILDELPDDCTLEDVQYRLYVVSTLDERVKEADTTVGLTGDEVRKRFAPWLTK